MSRLPGAIANLSSERRKLLQKKLRQKANITRTSGLHPLSIGPAPRAGAVPLSFAQQRLWFLDQLAPLNPFYNEAAALRLTGFLDRSALGQALNEIIRRHESLRTSFAWPGGQAVQLIAATLEITIPLVDLQELAPAEREAAARRLVVAASQQPFQLEQGPLLRVSLVRLDGEDHVLILVMHHIITDGWSTKVFADELRTLYKAFSTGQPSPLAQLPIQYADFAIWQRAWLQSKTLQRQLAYWKQQLKGPLPMLELPADHPRPAVQTYRGARQTFVLSEELTEQIKGLGQGERATPFMTLLAAFNILLARYTSQQDILVGTPISGRTRPELEGLIGFFVNTLVLRTRFEGNPSFLELLGRVRQVALGAYAHQEVPFQLLVEELQTARDLSGNPLFQVMFTLENQQNAPPQTIELSRLSLSLLDIGRDTSPFDLSVFMWNLDQPLFGYVEYNTDLFDHATIERMRRASSGWWRTLSRS